MGGMNSRPPPSEKPFQALVLAGDGGPDDGVARGAGVCCKALAPVATGPLLLVVLGLQILLRGDFGISWYSTTIK